MPLSDQSIVCFAPDPWQDLWRNRHRLLSVLARTNRILYVEPRTIARRLVRGLRSGTVRRQDFFRPRVEEVRPNLFVYHDPVHLPRIAWRVVGPAIDLLRYRNLRGAMRRLGLSNPILWLVRPDCWDVPGRLGERLVLYQIVDDYLTYGGMTDGARARVDSEERRLARHADLIVVTSEHLLEAKRHLGERMALVRNAVDDRTLEEGLRPTGPLPPELAGRPRPILGYIGGITEKLDLDLLERLAARWRDVRSGTLALVGVVNVNGRAAVESVSRLQAAANVVLTGRKDAHLVPNYLRAFDVCLVPYRLEGQSRGIDPLKLYEYLAFGKPIVTIDIPSVSRFSGLLRIVRSADDFVSQVDEAVGERDPSLEERRRAAARENSWERRAEELSAAIEDALAAKGSSPATQASSR